MEKHLRQSVVIQNRPGAGTLVGIRAAKDEPADGYTLLATGDAITLLPHIQQDPGYKIEDFTGIGIMARLPLVMVVPKNSPYKNVNEYISALATRRWFTPGLASPCRPISRPNFSCKLLASKYSMHLTKAARRHCPMYRQAVFR